MLCKLFLGSYFIISYTQSLGENRPASSWIDKNLSAAENNILANI